MSDTKITQERISFAFQTDLKKVLQKAADNEKRKLSDFIRLTLAEKAQNLIDSGQIILGDSNDPPQQKPIPRGTGTFRRRIQHGSREKGNQAKG